MSAKMKEQKEVLYRISKDTEAMDAYNREVEEFLAGGVRITRHAFEMHAKLSFNNVASSHNEGGAVGYFAGGERSMRSIVNKICQSAKPGLINFIGSHFERIELVRSFKKTVGYVVTDDDTVETRKVCVVIGKDTRDGYMTVITAYPIL